MKNKGQMLIEIVVSVGVLALVLIGVSDLMTRTQRLSNFQTKKDEANAIANSILNDYKLQKESDLDSFVDNVVGIDRSVCVEGKDYSCVATITDTADSVLILVKVSWVEGENTFSVSATQRL